MARNRYHRIPHPPRTPKTQMTQDEYSTARPTLKRWNNRNPTVKPQCARPNTEHRAPTKLKVFRPPPFIKSEARPADVQLIYVIFCLCVVFENYCQRFRYRTLICNRKYLVISEFD